MVNAINNTPAVKPAEIKTEKKPPVEKKPEINVGTLLTENKGIAKETEKKLDLVA